MSNGMFHIDECLHLHTNPHWSLYKYQQLRILIWNILRCFSTISSIFKDTHFQKDVLHIFRKITKMFKLATCHSRESRSKLQCMSIQVHRNLLFTFFMKSQGKTFDQGCEHKKSSLPLILGIHQLHNSDESAFINYPSGQLPSPFRAFFSSLWHFAIRISLWWLFNVFKKPLSKSNIYSFFLETFNLSNNNFQWFTMVLQKP